MFTVVRNRPHVVIARLDDSELRDFNYLLGSVDIRWCSNKSEAFRKVLRLATELLRERRVEEGRKLTFEYDFLPPKATRGPVSIEVEDPEDILDYEED